VSHLIAVIVLWAVVLIVIAIAVRVGPELFDKVN